MSERLGCERPDLFRAIASVTGATVERPAGATWINSSLSLSACDSAYAAATGKQSRPFSVLHVHGTADATVPWNGGGPIAFPSIPANMAAWYTRMGCSNATVQQTLDVGNFTNQLWSTCKYAGSQVELVKVEGGTHTWFNVLGQFSATAYVLDFFQRSAAAPAQATPSFSYDSASGSFSPPLPASRSDLPSPFLVNVSFSRPEGVRWFYLFVSSKAVSAAPVTVPLTFHFHGYTSSAAEGLYLDQASIEAGGWVLISGQGTLGPRPLNVAGFGWNAGSCCVLQQQGTPLYEPDDVTFTTTALAATKAMLSHFSIAVDPDRSARHTPLLLLTATHSAPSTLYSLLNMCCAAHPLSGCSPWA